MGGSGSSKPVEPIDFSLNHPKFSNSKLIGADKQRRMQTLIGVDNKQYENWKTRVKNSKLSSEYLLLPTKEEFSSKGLCGSSGILTLEFQDFPYLLTEQIANRKGKKKLFSENQLWYLLFVLMGAKNNIDPPFSKIGDVRPQNIFINEHGQVKVANIFSWPHEGTNFSKVLDQEVTYLAPQELKQLEIGALQNNNSGDLAQLFSIGLTLLSAATLEDFTSAYDLKKFELNFHKITDKLNEFKLNRAYSDIFKGVVCNLCEFDDKKRVNSKELWNWILPHEQKIKARENFFFPTAPEKIHQEVAGVRQFVGHSLGLHPSEGTGVRESGFSGQKLNFPPPIVRTSSPEIANSSTVHTYTGFSNPLVFNAQSTYIPASKLSGGDTTKTIADKTTLPIADKAEGDDSKAAKTVSATKLEPVSSDKKV